MVKRRERPDDERQRNRAVTAVYLAGAVMLAAGLVIEACS